MKTSVLLIALACTTVSGIVGWRVYADSHESVNHFAILDDQSVSYTGGCESVVGSAEQLLRTPGVTPRSKLMLLALGDSSTANEPRELGKYQIPVSRKVIEGKGASERQQAILLRENSEDCRLIRSTTISPIFMGVRQALADLHSEGCTETSYCQVRVNTDLEENVEAGIKERLASSHPLKPLPARLDNSGIDISFCGYAATAGRIVDSAGRERRFGSRNPAREDRMREVWSSAFTNPERVKFEPFCPKPTSPELYAKTNSAPARLK